jgi:hypothetical protein
MEHDATLQPAHRDVEWSARIGRKMVIQITLPRRMASDREGLE